MFFYHLRIYTERQKKEHILLLSHFVVNLTNSRHINYFFVIFHWMIHWYHGKINLSPIKVKIRGGVKFVKFRKIYLISIKMNHFPKTLIAVN